MNPKTIWIKILYNYIIWLLIFLTLWFSNAPSQVFYDMPIWEVHYFYLLSFNWCELALKERSTIWLELSSYHSTSHKYTTLLFTINLKPLIHSYNTNLACFIFPVVKMDNNNNRITYRLFGQKKITYRYYSSKTIQNHHQSYKTFIFLSFSSMITITCCYKKCLVNLNWYRSLLQYKLSHINIMF